MKIAAKLAFGTAVVWQASLASASPTRTEVKIDGSSSVGPLVEAAAEEFLAERPDVRVSVATSGTGGGFARLERGEADIVNASRRITDAESARLKAANIGVVELPVAMDALTVVVSAKNDFVKSVSKVELARIFGDDKATHWRDIRETWPKTEIRTFGPDADSGTFDFFRTQVLGDGGRPRQSYGSSGDDNVTVRAVASGAAGIGYLGYKFALENPKDLRIVALDGGKGAVLPGSATIADGTYPLARTSYVYVRESALKRQETRAFLDFFLGKVSELAPEVGYVALPKAALEEAKSRLREATGRAQTPTG